MEAGGSGARDERLFQLQLAFQKLEEEVKLYRNGTTAENLLELVNEKDREIAQLKTSLEATTDKLRRIAKGSSELIAKSEVLQKERDAGLRNEQELSEAVSRAEAELDARRVKMAALETEKAALEEQSRAEIAALQADKAALEEQAQQRDESIDKLQTRCAALVADKAEKSRQLEKERAERNQNTKDFVAQLEKGIKFNTEIKERLRKEQTNALALQASLEDTTSRLEATEVAKRAIKQELEESNAALRSDLKAARSENEGLVSRVAAMDHELRKMESTLKMKVLREKTNMQVPDFLDTAAKPGRPAQSFGLGR